MTDMWIKDTCFYHIYPLGMCGAPWENKGAETQGNRILKVIDWIPHLKELGVNAVYFGPIFESVTHGYDTTDYYKTDSRLGSKEDFKLVFDKLHDNGIRVVLDGVFNHTGREFFAFKSLREKGWESEYKDWFANLNFDGRSSYGDPFWYEGWHGCTNLVKLNLWNQGVREHLLGAVRMWIEEFHIDGLRLDAADCIEKDFFRTLRGMVKEIKPDFWLMGEIIHGDYNMWANPDMLDTVTNYECWKGIYSSHNDKNYFEINYAMNRQAGDYGIYKNILLYNFVDNHDVNRVASLVNNKAHLNNIYTLLYMMPGIPSIYYGSEWGIEGIRGQGDQADVPVRPELDINECMKLDDKLTKHIGRLAKLRQNSEAVKTGCYKQLLVKNEQLAFAREAGEDYVITCLNLSDHEETLYFSFRGQNYERSLSAFSSEVITKDETYRTL